MTSAPVIRLVFTVPGEHSTQVRPVRVGGQKLYAFSLVFPGTGESLRWKAYDS